LNQIAKDYVKSRSRFCSSCYEMIERGYAKASESKSCVTSNGHPHVRNDYINDNLSKLASDFDGISYELIPVHGFTVFVLVDKKYKKLLIAKREGSIDSLRCFYYDKLNNYLFQLLKQHKNIEHRYIQGTWTDIEFKTTCDPALLPSKYKDFDVLLLLHYGDIFLNDVQIAYTDERLEVLDRCGIKYLTGDSEPVDKSLVKLKPKEKRA